MPSSTTTDLLREAVALQRRGAVAEAAARYREVLRTDPDNADAYYYLGMMSCQAGQFDEGAEFARKALARDAYHANAHILLGRALSALGLHDEAIKRLQRAIALAPDLASPHSHFADVLSDLGRNAEAIDNYDRALALTPDCVEDWINRGIALNAIGQRKEALESFERAIGAKPEFARAHLERANVLWRLHRYDEALESIDKALARDLGFAEAWHSQGNILYNLGRYDAALAAFDKALVLKPDLVEAWLARGNTLFQIKRHEEASAAYDKALSLKADLAAAWLGLGNVHYKLKRFDEAFATYDKALALDSDLAKAWLGRGNVHCELRRFDEAFAAYDKALELESGLIEAWYGRGNVFYGLKRFDEASVAYNKVLALDSGLAEAWLGHGNVHYEVKRFDEAVAAYDKALALESDLAEAWVGRGNACCELKRFDEAFAAYNKALALKPDMPEAWFVYGQAYAQLKQYDNALAAYERVLSLRPDLKYARGAHLHAKMHLCDWAKIDAEILHLLSAVRDQKPVGIPFLLLSIPTSSADQLEFAKTFVSDQGSFSALWRDEIYLHDRIRLGYFSADFRHHPLAQLAVGLFEHHDRSRFEIMAISCGSDDGSNLRNRIRSAAENFVDVRGMPDSAVAEFIRWREIDILVDLSGFTQDNRFRVFARRASPVQVNFLCYTGTMGADCIDYIVADPTVIPKDHFQFYSEKVVWLPDTYQANDRSRPISGRRPTRSECNLPDAAFVFCCFNATYKITPEVFAVWMRLLGKREGSVLWLLETNPTAAQNLRREAEAHGIAPNRLIFAPTMPLADHMARIGLADLFLDTLPYNAHTTASDALWAGLPVLTCLGDTFAGRVAASLLRAIGLPELITTSLEDYAILALKLARDPPFLQAIKAKLVRNRDTFPIFDTRRFTRHIEAAYVTMWERYQRRERPEAFAVAPIK